MKKNKKAYSIIVVIVLIGFMILLTTGVFRLVLNEMQDNNSLWNYLKSYFWAEAGQELALLKIKEIWYGFNDWLKSEDGKKLLWDDKKTPQIYYTNNWKTKVHSWIIEPWEYNIIPLFYIENENWDEKKIENYILDIKNDKDKLAWNIVWKDEWITGLGNKTTKWDKRTVNIENSNSDDFGDITNEEVTVKDFLKNTKTNANYLMLFNSYKPEEKTNISYKITSIDWWFFTRPISEIVSTATIGNYKQNIETKIDFAAMRDRAKYTIFSPE